MDSGRRSASAAAMPVREGGWLASHPSDETRDFRMRPQTIYGVVVVAQFLLAQHGMDLRMADPVQCYGIRSLVGAWDQVMQVHAGTRHHWASAEGTDIGFGVFQVRGRARHRGRRYGRLPLEGSGRSVTELSIHHPW